MPEVIVALYDSYKAADAVRTALVADGFPTDRVELTASSSEGQSRAMPGGTLDERLGQYFDTLFDESDSERYAGFFVDGVKRGGAAVTVHPRGAEEVERASGILQQHQPMEMEGRDLGDRRSIWVGRSRDSRQS